MFIGKKRKRETEIELITQNKKIKNEKNEYPLKEEKKEEKKYKFRKILTKKQKKFINKTKKPIIKCKIV
jgi:hypothetical protein